MSEMYKYYPSTNEIDRWVDELFALAAESPLGTEVIDPESYEWPQSKNLPYQYAARHHLGAAYIKFYNLVTEEPFYGFWQPAFNTPAPLLIHVPGYGAEMSAHPELVQEGYNVLHISPLGYCTPKGMNRRKTADETDPLAWPQLPETIISGGKKGYKQWFIDCINAINWALKQTEVLDRRISFFGTSQGGGAALILASMFRDQGARCAAADVPFLTNYPLANGRGAYEIVQKALDNVFHSKDAWHALGFVDTLSHVDRLTMPILLTAGRLDEMCPPETVKSLYEKLKCTRSFTYIMNREHTYTPEFLHLCESWFKMYA